MLAELAVFPVLHSLMCALLWDADNMLLQQPLPLQGFESKRAVGVGEAAAAGMEVGCIP